MAFGSVQTIVACVPSASATVGQQVVCPMVGGAFYVPVTVQAYLIDASQQTNLEAALGPFDYAYASSIWGFAFTTVVGLFFVSHGIGLVLGMVRRG